MDESIIFYIIAAVIYVVSRLLKSKPKEGTNEYPDQDTQRRPMSFEDILRELGGETTVEEEEPYRPVPEKSKSQEKLPDTISRAEPSRQQAFEKVDNEVKNLYEKSVSEAKKIKTIDELVDYDQPREKILKEAPLIRKRNTGASTISKMLRNKSEARKAIILSEIIQRKYD